MSYANIRLINLYFKIGKMIYENSTRVNKFIETLKREVKFYFPNIKGFSVRNLGRIKNFYMEYMQNKILPTSLAKLPWTHHNVLLLFEKSS